MLNGSSLYVALPPQIRLVAHGFSDRAKSVDNVLSDAAPRDRAVRFRRWPLRARDPLESLAHRRPAADGDAQGARRTTPAHAPFAQQPDHAYEAAVGRVPPPPRIPRAPGGVPGTRKPDRAGRGRRAEACGPRKQEGDADVQLSVGAMLVGLDGLHEMMTISRRLR